MKLKSNSGYSLMEIGIALIIVGIFMTISVSLLSGSNENYRIIEQRNTALSYAIKVIESIQLNKNNDVISEIITEAKIKNNMDIQQPIIEKLPPKDGIDYDDKVQIVTVNVNYRIKNNDEEKTLTLKTLKINN